MSKTILFRFDASSIVGYGHAIRCFSLSEEFSARGYQPHFAVNSDGLPLLVKLGIQPERMHPLNVESGADLDALKTAEIAGSIGAKWIIVDGYGFSKSYQSLIRTRSGCFLLVVDDGVLDAYSAHIILNQNLGADAHSTYMVPDETRLLLGARYTLFRRQFHAEEPHPVRAEVRSIVLMFGGADPLNTTATMLETLSSKGALNNRRVRIIIGDAYKYRHSLESIQISDSCECHIIPYTSAIIEQYSWSDVVISAAGSTAWELALLGKPMALISTADNQIPVAESLAESGAAIYLGDIRTFDPNRVTENVVELLNNRKLREALHTRCRELFDCRGAARVVDEVENYARYIK